MEFTFFKLISYSFAALTHEISIWHTKIDSMSSRTYALFSFFFFIFFTAWTREKRFMRYDSWVMCGECWVFFYGMCWNNENNILTVCITQNNSNLFQSCLKPEEIKNENIYMLNAGPDFRWKGKANKLPVLLVQHGDK